MDIERTAAKAVTERANNPQEKVAEDQLVETALCGRIEELKSALRGERECVKRLKEEIKEGNRHISELESALRAEREKYQEYVTISENLTDAYDSEIERLWDERQQATRRINELETQQSETQFMVRSEESLEIRHRWGFQITAHQRREEISAVRTSGRFEMGSSNGRIHEQENNVRGAECDSQNVEAAPHGGIKEQSEKMKHTNSDRKEGESSLCGKVKKVVLVSAAVGLVVAAGWWLLS
jgi:predicted RNase H-like nuclease (RuvC/YqgF family)